MDDLLAKERMLESIRGLVIGGNGLTEKGYSNYGEKQSFSRTGISQGNSSYQDEIADMVHRTPNPRRMQNFDDDLPLEKSGRVEEMPATLAQRLRRARFEKWSRRQCKRKCVVCPQCIDDLRKIVEGE